MNFDRITFEQFTQACADAGLIALDHGAGHWQITGGAQTVNFYPFSRRGTIMYVGGTKGSRVARSMKQLLDASGEKAAPTVAMQPAGAKVWQPSLRELMTAAAFIGWASGRNGDIVSEDSNPAPVAKSCVRYADALIVALQCSTLEPPMTDDEIAAMDADAAEAHGQAVSA